MVIIFIDLFKEPTSGFDFFVCQFFISLIFSYFYISYLLCVYGELYYF